MADHGSVKIPDMPDVNEHWTALPRVPRRLACMHQTWTRLK